MRLHMATQTLGARAFPSARSAAEVAVGPAVSQEYADSSLLAPTEAGTPLSPILPTPLIDPESSFPELAPLTELPKVCRSCADGGRPAAAVAAGNVEDEEVLQDGGVLVVRPAAVIASQISALQCAGWALQRARLAIVCVGGRLQRGGRKLRRMNSKSGRWLRGLVKSGTGLTSLLVTLLTIPLGPQKYSRSGARRGSRANKT